MEPAGQAGDSLPTRVSKPGRPVVLGGAAGPLAGERSWQAQANEPLRPNIWPASEPWSVPAAV